MLPVCPAYALEDTPLDRRWLVENLWGEEAVGIVGGEPKCCKSYLALTLAAAVASGKPCFGRFKVPKPGRVLLFAAEDAPQTVRRRLEGICAAERLELRALPIFVITRPVLRLDVEHDREALKKTVQKLAPRLLILDPFVRLHRIDENSSTEVAAILDHLRILQRSFRLAVTLVHHARKGGGRMRAGQALRGSSEFHAWGDSNLYLRRSASGILSLSAEHRAEAAPPSMQLQLADGNGAPHLVLRGVVADPPLREQKDTARERLLSVLQSADQPLRIRSLRSISQLRHSTVSDTVADLEREGVIQKSDRGYILSTQT